MQPIAFVYSRQIERVADRFGLEIIRNSYAMASALTLLHDETLHRIVQPWLESPGHIEVGFQGRSSSVG